MITCFDFKAYFAAVVKKDAAALRTFFREDAVINWHNTRERFDSRGFIRANCDYPGEWRGEIEREYRIGNTVIAAARVWSADDPSLSFHCCSFIHLKDERIIQINEYWGDDGEPPEWRKDCSEKTSE
ncbi:MAG: nuclear transport factor 2 family protein [Clostridia bacterium]|nr:nuclear transport factor 2 family protein [Clostridia bacterium]